MRDFHIKSGMMRLNMSDCEEEEGAPFCFSLSESFIVLWVKH